LSLENIKHAAVFQSNFICSTWFANDIEKQRSGGSSSSTPLTEDQQQEMIKFSAVHGFLMIQIVLFKEI
jgi:hypothetical protein